MMKLNRKQRQLLAFLIGSLALLSSFQNCAPSDGFSSQVSDAASLGDQQVSNPNPDSGPDPVSTPQPAPLPLPEPVPAPQPSPMPVPAPTPLPVPSPPPDPVAITYYVDASHPMASDTNSGKSKDAPWKTLAAVNSKRFQPGETVGFKRGTGYSGGLRISSSGVAGKPILFTAYGDGADPVFSNSGKWSESIILEGSYVILEKMKVTEAYEAGVQIGSKASYNEVRFVEATGVGVAVQIQGSNNLIHHVYAHDLKMVTNTVGGDDDWGANGFIIGGPNNELAFNKCLRCIAASYDYGTDGGMFELYGVTDNTFIHHNICEDSDGLFEAGGSAGASAKNIRIAYNLIINSRFGGLHAVGTFATVISNFRIENNTIVDTRTRTPTVSALFWVGGTLPTNAVIFRNNLFSVRSFQNIFQQAFTRSNNLYQLLTSSTGIVGGSRNLSTHEWISDPLFVDPGNGDFHLRVGSPVEDKGVDLGYTFDLDGKPLSGAAPDLGVFEK